MHTSLLLLLCIASFASSFAVEDALFSPRNLAVCTIENHDEASAPTTLDFYFYVAVGYLEETIPVEVAQQVAEKMWTATDLHLQVCARKQFEM